jgi:hypothetical protein
MPIVDHSPHDRLEFVPRRLHERLSGPKLAPRVKGPQQVFVPVAGGCSGLVEVVGGIAVGDSLRAWLGVDQLRQSLRVGGPPMPVAVSRRVRSATEIFLRGWATPAAGNADKR